MCVTHIASIYDTHTAFKGRHALHLGPVCCLCVYETYVQCVLSLSRARAREAFCVLHCHFLFVTFVFMTGGFLLLAVPVGGDVIKVMCC